MKSAMTAAGSALRRCLSPASLRALVSGDESPLCDYR